MLAVGGCTTNHSIGTIQINQDTELCPPTIATSLRMLYAVAITIGGADLLISDPNTMIGEGHSIRAAGTYAFEVSCRSVNRG